MNLFAESLLVDTATLDWGSVDGCRVPRRTPPVERPVQTKTRGGRRGRSPGVVGNCFKKDLRRCRTLVARGVLPSGTYLYRTPGRKMYRLLYPGVLLETRPLRSREISVPELRPNKIGLSTCRTLRPLHREYKQNMRTWRREHLTPLRTDVLNKWKNSLFLTCFQYYTMKFLIGVWLVGVVSTSFYFSFIIFL